jgi:hypothetical protein
MKLFSPAKLNSTQRVDEREQAQLRIAQDELAERGGLVGSVRLPQWLLELEDGEQRGGGQDDDGSGRSGRRAAARC